MEEKIKRERQSAAEPQWRRALQRRRSKTDSDNATYIKSSPPPLSPSLSLSLFLSLSPSICVSRSVRRRGLSAEKLPPPCLSLFSSSVRLPSASLSFSYPFPSLRSLSLLLAPSCVIFLRFSLPRAKPDPRRIIIVLRRGNPKSYRLDRQEIRAEALHLDSLSFSLVPSLFFSDDREQLFIHTFVLSSFLPNFSSLLPSLSRFGLLHTYAN